MKPFKPFLTEYTFCGNWKQNSDFKKGFCGTPKGTRVFLLKYVNNICCTCGHMLMTYDHDISIFLNISISISKYLEKLTFLLFIDVSYKVDR